MFIAWMWSMDWTKALKPFFVASTKFWQVVESFIWTLVLLTCWPHLVANLVKSSNGTNDYAFKQILLFAFGGRSPRDYIPGIHWTCGKDVVTFFIVGLFLPSVLLAYLFPSMLLAYLFLPFLLMNCWYP